MVTKQEAEYYLREVPPDQRFWVNNGPILRNLEDLANFLPNIKDEAFRHHVNRDKNDFSTWINDVIGDKALANELVSSKSRDSAIKKVQKRLGFLRNKAGIMMQVNI